jgi:CPA2 family monovalent cation:H+ antiporter-2
VDLVFDSVGVSAPPLVSVLAITVAAAAIFGYLAQRIGLVSIVGYLLAGLLIGPHALGLVAELDLVEQMGEIGVIFLMFFIGLELSGDLIKKMGALMIGGGALQVGLTVAAVTVVLIAFGVDVNTGIYTGCLVALSSTAVVLKLLSKRNGTSSPKGEVAVAFLVFQDIAVVILVLLVPMLGEGGGSIGDILWAAGVALVLIGLVIVVAKWVIPAVLDRSQVHRRRGDAAGHAGDRHGHRLRRHPLRPDGLIGGIRSRPRGRSRKSP